MNELWAFLTQTLEVKAVWFVLFAYLAFKLGRMLELKAICDCFELIPKDYYGEEF
jgi:arginine exporter protein ArgO